MSSNKEPKTSNLLIGEDQRVAFVVVMLFLPNFQHQKVKIKFWKVTWRTAHMCVEGLPNKSWRPNLAHAGWIGYPRNMFLYICFLFFFEHLFLDIKSYTLRGIFSLGIKVSKVGDPKALFSIAITLRCRGGRYSFPWIVPIYPWSLPYNAEC